jgi:hypothetical protein
MQAGLRIGRVRRENFKFRGSVELHHALIGPTEGDTTFCPGAQPIMGMQGLLGLRGRPSVRAGGRNFHCALGLHDADFVIRSASRCISGERLPNTGRETAQNRRGQYRPSRVPPRVQTQLFQSLVAHGFGEALSETANHVLASDIPRTRLLRRFSHIGEISSMK